MYKRQFLIAAAQGGAIGIACPEIAAQIAVGSIHNSISDDPQFCRKNGDKPEIVFKREFGGKVKRRFYCGATHLLLRSKFNGEEKDHPR